MPKITVLIGIYNCAPTLPEALDSLLAQTCQDFKIVLCDDGSTDDTAAVVQRFQQQFSLTADGVVGYATWYKISYIYVAVKKLAELGSEGEVPNQDSVGNAEGAFPGTNLTVGSSGTAVRQVQYWLNTVRGYIDGLPLLAVDGQYGTATAEAVRIFQRWAGLTADGIVGPATWNKLYREFSSVILEEDTELGYVTEYPGTALRQGSRSAAVRTLQFWLLVISDEYPQVPAIEVDGSYGPATAAAVRAFQQVFGLTADGVVSGQLWECAETYPHLTSVTYEGNGSPLMLSVQKELGVPTPTGIIGSGTIAMLQGWLYLHGYSCAADKAGVLGDATARAVQQSLNDGRWKA